MSSCTLPSIVVSSFSFLTHFITSSPPPTLVCALSSLSSSSPSSRQRFPTPHHSRGHLPFPSRNDQPPGDRHPWIGRRQRGVAVLASPRCCRATIHRRRRRRADHPRCCRHRPSYCPPPALFLVDCCFVIVASQRTRRHPEGSWFDGGGGPVGEILCSGGRGRRLTAKGIQMVG